jgi:protein phosphatase 2C family protein 2/3
LSLSRAFGDIAAKLPRWGGLPRVLVCEPEILSFRLDDRVEFVVLGCDGIFDRMHTQEVLNLIWDTPAPSVEAFAKEAVTSVIRRAMAKYSTDNLSFVIIGFPSLLKAIRGQEKAGPTGV